MSIQDLIISRIHLNKKSNTGFHTIKCAVCKDYKDRAGFKFEGDTIGYSCFNCGAKAKYIEGSESISKSMKHILNMFGISNEDISNVLDKLFFKIKENSGIEIFTLSKIANKNNAIKFLTPEIELPAGSYRLESAADDDIWKEIAESYLELRNIKLSSNQFYLSNDPRYRSRIIIPYLRHGKIIYWQARSLDPDLQPRYLNSPNPKDPIIFGYDELYNWSDLPLFVFEGVIDALSVNGVALLGSSINETKIEILKRSKRRLIFVIDPDHNGKNFAKVALANNWEITFPPERMGDVNQSICEVGKIWTIKCLMDNIVGNSLSAELKLNFWCGS